MSNAEQEEFWSDAAGPKWVAMQEKMDGLLAPVLDLVMERAPLAPGDTVLDVGCGTGHSVVAALDAVGPTGHVTGLDIARTMLDLAGARLNGAPNVTLIKADAQSYPFDTSFDAMISRFGVMFFGDTVAALRNLNAALRPGGTMTFAAWGPAPQNPYFMVPAKAATGVLGDMPKVDRTLPGPFAFENSACVLDMMHRAGLTDPRVETVDLQLTPPGTLADIAAVFMQIGPAQRAVEYHQADAAAAEKVQAAVASAMAPFMHDDGMRIPACIHVYSSRKAA